MWAGEVPQCGKLQYGKKVALKPKGNVYKDRDSVLKLAQYLRENRLGILGTERSTMTAM